MGFGYLFINFVISFFHNFIDQDDLNPLFTGAQQWDVMGFFLFDYD